MQESGDGEGETGNSQTGKRGSNAAYFKLFLSYTFSKSDNSNAGQENQAGESVDFHYNANVRSHVRRVEENDRETK